MIIPTKTIAKIPQIPVCLQSSFFPIILDKEIQKKIDYICSQISTIEWSGTLFYNVEGDFHDGSLAIRVMDILPQDIGDGTYTVFNSSPKVVTHMCENPELMDCYTGLVH